MYLAEKAVKVPLKHPFYQSRSRLVLHLQTDNEMLCAFLARGVWAKDTDRLKKLPRQFDKLGHVLALKNLDDECAALAQKFLRDLK